MRVVLHWNHHFIDMDFNDKLATLTRVCLARRVSAGRVSIRATADDFPLLVRVIIRRSNR